MWRACVASQLQTSRLLLTIHSKGNAKGKDPIPTGNCAELPADRATEFHGNPHTSELNLAMAGNQWVVFNKVMTAFNERRVANGEGDVVTDGLNYWSGQGKLWPNLPVYSKSR